MDKTLALIFVATVLLITAVTVTAFFTTSLEDTTDDLDTLQEESPLDFSNHYSSNELKSIKSSEELEFIGGRASG